MKTIKTSFLIILTLILLLVSSSVFTIREGHRGILLRLGKIATVDDQGTPKILKPGLHFKLPIINQVRKMDVRIQTLDVQAARVPTKEQKFLDVDYFAKWKIEDPALFFTRTRGSKMRTEELLQQQINDDIRAEFNTRSLLQVISEERGTIMDLLKNQAKISANKLGIKVIDVRIKRIELPGTINNAVYERMRKRRLILARTYRSTGLADAQKIRAKAEATANITKANARAEAAKIVADGVRKAAKIYADAYNQDLEFYTYYQSLMDYRTIFSESKDMIVLDPESQFFQYFKQSSKKTG